MPTPLLSTLLIVSTSVCFGMVPFFGRVLLDTGLSAEAIALYRFCLALPLALAFFPRRWKTLRPVTALVGAGMASGVGWTAYLNVLDDVSVASAGVIYMSYPLFVVILARLLVGQRITLRAALGALLVLVGVFIANAPGPVPAAQWLALVSSLPAPVGFALIVVLLAAAGHELSTLERWSAICVGHVAGLLPAAVFSGSGTIMPEYPATWMWIGGLAVVTATLPQILYTFAARHVPPARAAAAGAAELPTMMAVGLLAFGETVGIREAAGAILVVVAIGVAPSVSSASSLATRAPAGVGNGAS